MPRPHRPMALFRLPSRSVNNLATMTLAPPGTPLWHPQKDDFAPRLGMAWQPLPNLVFRAGAGIFYDLGYSDVADGIERVPIRSAKDYSQYLIPAERRQCRAASFYDDSPCFVPCGGRPESRIAQNV